MAPTSFKKPLASTNHKQARPTNKNSVIKDPEHKIVAVFNQKLSSLPKFLTKLISHMYPAMWLIPDQNFPTDERPKKK